MNFEESFRRLIGHEGGYTTGAGDPGGETKFGISKRSYPYLDIKNLTLEQAKEIYRRDFWIKPHIEELPPAIRFDMFDAGVNHGASQAARFLQRALDVADDGVIGPVTLAAAWHGPHKANLVARFNGERLLFFSKLSTWPRFGRGWTRRVAENLLIEAEGIDPSPILAEGDDGWFTNHPDTFYSVMLSSNSKITITEGERQ